MQARPSDLTSGTLNDLVLISNEELRELVSLDEAIKAVRQAFIDLARGVLQQPQRLAMADGSTLAMMAKGSPPSGTVVKIVSLRDDNRLRGVPTIQGSVLWLDGETGKPEVLVEAASLTALRTGAATAVATDVLAPRGARTLTMIGAGAQAPDQVRAVASVRPIEKVKILSKSHTSALALARRLEDELAPTSVDAVTSIELALDGADIVCCATNTAVPIVRLSSLGRRVHINAIGSYREGMRELAPDVLGAARLICVDQVSAALNEGELVDAVKEGVIDVANLIELGRAIERPPTIDEGISIFKSVGLAIQDWAVMRLVAERLPLQRPAV